jgi:hypothetical protein
LFVTMPAVPVSRPDTVAPALLVKVPAFDIVPVQVRLLVIVPALDATLPVQSPLLAMVPLLERFPLDLGHAYPACRK